MASFKPKREVWPGDVDGEPQTRILDTVLVQVSNKAQEKFSSAIQRLQRGTRALVGTTAASSVAPSEDDRIVPRRIDDRSNLKRAPFVRLNIVSTEASSNNLPRSKTMGATIYRWFLPRGSSNHPVKVPAVDSTKKNKMLEIDVSEEYCKPHCWKQLIRFLREQSHSA